MKTSNLTQQYSIIILNGEEDTNSIVMKLKNRCIVASVLLNAILEGKMQNKINDRKDLYFGNKEDGTLDNITLAMYKEVNMQNNLGTLSEWLDAIQKISQKACDKIAGNVKDIMIRENLLEKIPSLLECDLNYASAGISIKQYRASQTLYMTTIDYIKAEILEEGEISEETICLIWLIKQSDDLSKIFSAAELKIVEEKYIKLFQKNEFAHTLFKNSIKTNGAVGVKRLLAAKKSISNTSFGHGFVSKIPCIEKSESIFLATESMFESDEERVTYVKKELIDKGHICEIKHVGKISLVEIDNILYELVPDAIRMRLTNIHGVRLRKYVI